MIKIDKTKYNKEEIKKLKEQRQITKSLVKYNSLDISLNKCSFVVGNGTSRKGINLASLRPHGKIYGCNAIYRDFDPDYLVAVDVKMVLEINKNKYQYEHEVWTNPNRIFNDKIKKINYFNPSKGWSSGPTALWLASEHGYNTIFILGFDYKGLKNGEKVNNVYSGTLNYKKDNDRATYYGNWLKQTCQTIKNYPKIHYIRVIQPDNFCPEELNIFENFSTISIEQFRKYLDI